MIAKAMTKARSRRIGFQTPSVDEWAAGLNRKWIEGCIAEDPERQHDEKQQPDIFRVELVSLDRPATHYGVRMTYERIEQNGQHQHHQWIKPKSPSHASMQQVVKSAGGAAPWTGKSSQREEGANKK